MMWIFYVLAVLIMPVSALVIAWWVARDSRKIVAEARAGRTRVGTVERR